MTGRGGRSTSTCPSLTLPSPVQLPSTGRTSFPLSPQHPQSHLCLLFLGGGWGSRPCCSPNPGPFLSWRLLPTPCHLALPAPVGSEAGGGLGSANGSPLPAILPPCLSHLCPPQPSPSITIPLSGPGENDIDRRPPPRGGGGAKGRLVRKGSEAAFPHPPSLPHPAACVSP